MVANFDRIGVQVTLAGANVSGATGDYTDGDLDGTNIVIEGAREVCSRWGPPTPSSTG